MYSDGDLDEWQSDALNNDEELQNIMDFVLWSNPDAKGAGIDLDSVK